MLTRSPQLHGLCPRKRSQGAGCPRAADRIAGVNVLALINSHAAAALQYGIERDFTNRSEWVALYDMGAASTEAALVRYSSFSVKEYGKAKTYRRARATAPGRAAAHQPCLAPPMGGCTRV